MTAATDPAVFDAALTYAERHGWYCFPCKPRAKTPLTLHGLLEATRDPEQLARWARQYPDANIGVRTGPESGIVVLDVDGDDGYESLRTLERRYQVLPRTASIKTPRGGAHYWFAHRGDIPNSAGRLGPCLDVRGTGGYVLAPPSVGANGTRYEPDEVAPVVALPEWLRDLMAGGTTSTAKAKTPKETWIAMVRDGIPDGERNTGLTRIVGHLLARNVDAELVVELALLINGRCRPPLPDFEVERIVESIASRDLRRRQVKGERR